MAVPVTSISLLKVLGEDAQSPRWTEFANKYASMIDGYLIAHFPKVNKEEVVNDTLIVLTKKLPLYEYDPDTKGHFSNFLIGIVKNKAREWLKKFRRDEERRAALEEKAQYEWEYEKQSYRVDLRDWRKEAYEAALTQFMANPNLSSRDKEIFRRTALNGEAPADVAEIFGITRNNVDQIKARMTAKLKELALKYASVCDS
jgi:RNA polymerase sigma factor (sigma-70 family)